MYFHTKNFSFNLVAMSQEQLFEAEALPEAAGQRFVFFLKSGPRTQNGAADIINSILLVILSFIYAHNASWSGLT